MCAIISNYLVVKFLLKAAVLQFLKKKWKKITVNTGPVMFSREIYFTDPLIQ